MMNVGASHLEKESWVVVVMLFLFRHQESFIAAQLQRCQVWVLVNMVSVETVNSVRRQFHLSTERLKAGQVYSQKRTRQNIGATSKAQCYI